MCKDFKFPFDLKTGEWYLGDYTAILRLDAMLADAGIPHETKRMLDGWQIIYPEDGEKRVMDAIEHHGSYGKDEDLLEIMGLLTPEEEADGDTVVGYLTAEEVFKRIKNHYLGIKPKKSKRKYKKGEPITSLDELANQEIVFVYDKPTHRGWFMSWQFRFAKTMVDGGKVFKAYRNET